MVAVTPPSTGRATPVMNDESGDSRNDTAAASSDASPQRAMGTTLRMVSSTSGRLCMPAVMPVLVGPGQTALTRMPSWARSRATDLARLITAALEAL